MDFMGRKIHQAGTIRTQFLIIFLFEENVKEVI